MLLSATSEVYGVDLSSGSKIVSYIIAIFVLIASITLPVLAFYVFWKYRNNYDPEKRFILMEFIADLRNAKVARIYMAVLLVRRIIFVVLVIFLIESPREFIYSMIICRFGTIIL